MKTVRFLLIAATLPLMAQAADRTPEQCFEDAKQVPAEEQQRFVQGCLGEAPAGPSTVSAEQRAKVCDSIADSERFQGEQRAAFLKTCKGG